MAAALGGEPGGILSLDALLEEYAEAIEYDLITMGLKLRNLGTDELSWGDLKAVISCSPHTSALYRARQPREHEWRLDRMLLADIADSLRWLVWAKSSDAQHGRNRPEPIPRPGVKDVRERIGDSTTVSGVNEMLGWGVSKT
ncbi:DUF5361 domain-containing protein [Nocardia rhizosphaerae]|uniref:DUF5361 domain-containing protein n=1 Tax=Nocardia rhizosphaerae TaxID=1691571 RepID=A0ABV8KYX2_9NOCA